MRPRNAVVSVVRAIGLEAALASRARMADRVPSALPDRSTGYIVHGIKRRSSSYNHPRLEHIMEEGTHRDRDLCSVRPLRPAAPIRDRWHERRRPSRRRARVSP